MGYACPVCEDPQADAEHLANHLAFTALLGDDAHEAWLDEHAPDWDQADADALAATVTEIAAETDYPQVFENTVDGHDHDHDHERSGALFDDEGRAVERGRERARDLSGLDDADEDILEEAREMTRRMRGEGESEGGDADADATDSETE
ncbi:DUF5810 domain-containing protein [Halorientalis pallida]|uniref:Uncharacterized protein n=1 Tax=Halorientalis pallida TaxID=2479928 RepID=A0A498KUX8_9EURY|nr:DUF5810 domain-containing protein [Halorientalis pallida]RXK47319.1 hypothetical protein EAF64_16180 [Halorientalis pallida]